MVQEEVRFFSADSHVNEPPEAWERIPKRLREHGPHFVQDPPERRVSTWFSMAMNQTR